MSLETARSAERPLDKVLSAFGIPTEEQKARIFRQILQKKSTMVYFLSPDEIQGPDKVRSSRTLLKVSKNGLIASVNPRLSEILQEELNGSYEYQIQTRPLPGGGNSWSIRDDSVERRVRLFLGNLTEVPVVLQALENERWAFQKKFPPFDLQTMSGLIDFVAGHFNQNKLTSVGWPGAS